MKEKVALAFSGGADSTYAAIILKNMGYDVYAFNFPIGRHVSEDVFNVAKKLSIKLEIIDIRKIFDQVIKENFYNSYLDGFTPNPCVRCNRYIKFGLLYTIIKSKYKIELFSTGHYAKIIKDEKGRYLISKPRDKDKDQTYFLWQIDKSILPYIIFPLQDTIKKELKDILVDEGFTDIAKKEESYDVCFINDDSYKNYIIKHGIDEKNRIGYFIDQSGRILSAHDGIYRYTIGQRKGLKISFGKRMYVRRIDPIKNEVEIGEKPYSKHLKASSINLFIDEDELTSNKEYYAKIRYKSKEEKLKLSLIKEEGKKKLLADFINPVESSSCGQSLVVYHNDAIIAGGIIEKIDLI